MRRRPATTQSKGLGSEKPGEQAGRHVLALVLAVQVPVAAILCTHTTAYTHPAQACTETAPPGCTPTISSPPGLPRPSWTRSLVWCRSSGYVRSRARHLDRDGFRGSKTKVPILSVSGHELQRPTACRDEIAKKLQHPVPCSRAAFSISLQPNQGTSIPVRKPAQQQRSGVCTVPGPPPIVASSANSLHHPNIIGRKNRPSSDRAAQLPPEEAPHF